MYVELLISFEPSLDLFLLDRYVLENGLKKHYFIQIQRASS
jgi:hypothetical protein